MKQFSKKQVSWVRIVVSFRLFWYDRNERRSWYNQNFNITKPTFLIYALGEMRYQGSGTQHPMCSQGPLFSLSIKSDINLKDWRHKFNIIELYFQKTDFFTTVEEDFNPNVQLKFLRHFLGLPKVWKLLVFNYFFPMWLKTGFLITEEEDD